MMPQNASSPPTLPASHPDPLHVHFHHKLPFWRACSARLVECQCLNRVCCQNQTLRTSSIWLDTVVPKRGLHAAPISSDLALRIFSKKKQRFDLFRQSAPFFTCQTNRTVGVIIIGPLERLEETVHVQKVCAHLEAFVGFRLVVRSQPLALGKWTQPRTGVDGNEQLTAQALLAEVQNLASPRSVRTVGLTAWDIYPPRMYDFVTGISNIAQRCAVDSTARSE